MKLSLAKKNYLICRVVVSQSHVALTPENVHEFVFMFSAASFVQVKKGSVGVTVSEKKANLFFINCKHLFKIKIFIAETVSLMSNISS
jgi:hypothetical protein